MAIKGLEGMTDAQVNQEILNGGKFVIFLYCFSVLVMSFKRGSEIHFVKANENVFVKSLPYSLISIFFGWWGIPWGLIWTPYCLYINLKGGRNVTTEIMASLQQPEATSN